MCEMAESLGVTVQIYGDGDEVTKPESESLNLESEDELYIVEQTAL